jgi:hypothetical protein
MAAEGAGTAARPAEAELPYRPSWVDYITHSIDRLRIPAWATYLVLLVVNAFLVNALNWIVDPVLYPPWTFEPRETGFAVFPIYLLAMIHYLDGVARTKLAQFRPALDVDEARYRRLEQELTTMPAREAAIASGIGTALAVVVYVPLLSRGLGLPAIVLLALALRILAVVLAFALATALIYHTVHQLRLVTRVHALATNIDLFEPHTLGAFSELTARTGLGVALLVAYSFLQDPETDLVVGVLLGIALAAAVAAFVLPLQGMHGRLVQEKHRLQSEVDRRLKAAMERLHRSVDEHDLTTADPLNKQLDSLKLERDVIAQLPTWPWERGTPRAFVSALLLPIFLWLIFRVLERVV